jgi:hypothetical protein
VCVKAWRQLRNSLHFTIPQEPDYDPASEAIWIHSILSRPIEVNSVLVLSFPLRLSHLCIMFPLRVSTKTLSAFLFFRCTDFFHLRHQSESWLVFLAVDVEVYDLSCEVPSCNRKKCKGKDCFF